MPMMPAVMTAEAIPKTRTNGCNFGDLANDLVLKLLLVGDVLAKEELIFFISGQLSLVGKQAEETGCDCCPDNKENW